MMNLKKCGARRCRNNVLSNSKHLIRIFTISKLFGMFPFRLQKGYIRISVPFSFLSIGVMSFLFYKAIFIVYRILRQKILVKGVPVGLGQLVLSTIMISFALYFIAGVATFFFGLSYFNKILHELQSIDMQLITLGGCTPKCRFKKSYYLGAVLVLAQITIFPWGPQYSIAESQLFYVLTRGCIWLTGSQISAIGELFDCRIVGTCSLLRSKLSLEAPRRSETIASLANVHNRLCDVCSVLNKCLNSMLLFHIAFCVTCLTTTTFYVYNEMVLISDLRGKALLIPIDANNFNLMVSFIPMCLSIIAIWQTVVVFADISKKLKTFNSLLYRLMIKDKTKTLLNNGRLRLHVAMSREITFTACEFFDLDYPLLHNILAAVTTNLVILLEFRKTGV